MRLSSRLRRRSLSRWSVSVGDCVLSVSCSISFHALFYALVVVSMTCCSKVVHTSMVHFSRYCFDTRRRVLIGISMIDTHEAHEYLPIVKVFEFEFVGGSRVQETL